MAAPNGSMPPPAQVPREYREDLNNLMMCPDCKEDPPNLVEEFSSGDMVCGSCGLVLGDRIIDTRSEWRTFSNDDQGGDDPSRVGDAPNMLLDEGDGLHTRIGPGAMSRSARALTTAQNKMTQNKSSKQLVGVYSKIDAFAQKMSLGQNVITAAKFIYKEVDAAKLFKGKQEDAVIAGCMLVACRQFAVGRTFKDLKEVTEASKKDIGRVFKLLENFLGKKGRPAAPTNANVVEQHYDASLGSTKASTLCERYCSKLRFRQSAKIERVSRELADQTTGIKDLAGRSPLSVAAACIYFACNLLGEERSSRDISHAAGVSDGTVKTAYRFLLAAKDQVLKQEWLEPMFGGSVSNLKQT